MDNFELQLPTRVFFGRGVEKQVGVRLKERGCQKVLVHFGGSSARQSGLLERIEAQLTAEGIAFVELGGVEPNPRVELVRKGVALVQQAGIDFILAIGGGSVIDSAKAIAASTASGKDVWTLISERCPIEAALPVGCVLTLAAAGSEMSASAVLTNGLLKRSMRGDAIRPVMAFMNPELTFTVSRYQTACGIVDILMHTLERYFTEAKHCELTDRLSEGLLKAVIDAGRKVLADGRDYEARATLMWASSLSHNNLMSCGKSYYFPAHKLEHDVSGLYANVAHGAGLAVLFPAWAKFVYRHDVRKFSQFAVRVLGLQMNCGKPENTALAAIEELKDYFKEIGMPTTLAELGVMPEDYERLADLTTDGGTKTVLSYVPLTKQDLLEIYKLAES